MLEQGSRTGGKHCPAGPGSSPDQNPNVPFRLWCAGGESGAVEALGPIGNSGIGVVDGSGEIVQGHDVSPAGQVGRSLNLHALSRIAGDAQRDVPQRISGDKRERERSGRGDGEGPRSNASGVRP